MNVFELAAILTLNTSQFEKSLADAKGKASGLGQGFKNIGKMIAVGVAAGTTAVAALAGKSVAAYADYEQMVGGVKKLYGNMGMTLEEYAKDAGKSTSEVKSEWENLEKAQNTVLNNAKSAYKTSGMSMNQYMETATSFSASLINSLDGDTVAAAKQTDVAMKAISDNWNTFGGDISRIQDAYRGFAKSNFTMLDNLSLGYGGTKTEMERLIADANEYAKANGKAADLSIDSFSDIVTAIELVQEKQHIAGTTAREASTTIAGSMGMAKAAWENLLTGFADSEADIGELASEFVDSFGTAAGLIIPRFAEAFQGIVSAVPDLVTGMAGALSENLGGFAQSGMAIIQSISAGLAQGIPNLLSQILPMITSFSGSLRENAGSLVDSGIEFITNLAQGIANSLPLLIEYVPTIVSNIAGLINDNMPKILEAAFNIIVTLGKGLIDALPVLVDNIPRIAKAAFDAFLAFNWLSLGRNIIKAVGRGLKAAGGLVKTALSSIAKNGIRALRNGFSAAKTIGSNMIKAVGKAIGNGLDGVKNAVAKVAKGALEKFKNLWDNVSDIGLNLVKGIWSGISSGYDWITGLIKNWVGNVKSFIKGLFGIKSPSTWARDMIGANLVKGMAAGIEDNGDIFDSALESLVNVPDLDIGTKAVGANEDLFGMMKSVQMVNNIQVDGAENPEEYANRFVRQLQMDMRTI